MSGNVETCSCCWDQPPDGGDWSAEAGWRGRLEMGEGGPVSVVCEPLLPSLCSWGPLARSRHGQQRGPGGAGVRLLAGFTVGEELEFRIWTLYIRNQESSPSPPPKYAHPVSMRAHVCPRGGSEWGWGMEGLGPFQWLLGQERASSSQWGGVLSAVGSGGEGALLLPFCW